MSSKKSSKANSSRALGDVSEPPGKPPPTSGVRSPRDAPAASSQASSPTSGVRELSAGGVVVHKGEVLVIVPTRRAADGSHVLGLPKGHLDDGETILQAAIREVREETGVEVELMQELGEVRYWYVRDRRRVAKSVHFFLFNYRSGDPADHDEEVLEARWMGLAEAQKALTYAGEREMVGRALAICQQDR